MREYPHAIFLIKPVSFHDLRAITFHSFKKNKILNTHTTYDVCKKTKRQLDHRVKTDEPANAWIHFFNGKGSMTATKCMYPTICFYCISHDRSRLLDFFQLGFFYFIHNASRILQPGFRQHIFIYSLIFEEIVCFIEKI